LVVAQHIQILSWEIIDHILNFTLVNTAIHPMDFHDSSM